MKAIKSLDVLLRSATNHPQRQGRGCRIIKVFIYGNVESSVNPFAVFNFCSIFKAPWTCRRPEIQAKQCSLQSALAIPALL